MLAALQSFPIKIAQRETWEDYGIRCAQWYDNVGRRAEKANRIAQPTGCKRGCLKDPWTESYECMYCHGFNKRRG